VSPVKYELGFYIPEDDILHSHCRENVKLYMLLFVCYGGNSVKNLTGGNARTRKRFVTPLLGGGRGGGGRGDERANLQVQTRGQIKFSS
jgi:hypothetical protein